MNGLLKRLGKFNDRVALADADVWAIVSLHRYMARDARRPPNESEIESCCAWHGADAGKVLLYFYGARPGRWWRWCHRVKRRGGG